MLSSLLLLYCCQIWHFFYCVDEIQLVISEVTLSISLIVLPFSPLSVQTVPVLIALEDHHQPHLKVRPPPPPPLHPIRMVHIYNFWFIQQNTRYSIKIGFHLSNVDTNVDSSPSTSNMPTISPESFGPSPTPTVDNVNANTSDADHSSNDEITIKLKYLNDSMRVVKAKPNEPIGDFKK